MFHPAKRTCRRKTSPTGSPRKWRGRRKPVVHTKTVWSAAKAGIPLGAIRKSVYLTEWDIAGRCENPVRVSLSGRPYMDCSTNVGASSGIDMDVRCRKCPSCLKARGALWLDRALRETDFSPRTWFGTLTLSPERHHWVVSTARQIEALQGCDFDAFGHEEQFALRCAVIGREITRFLKRVRKDAEAGLRYLLVAESHKSGLPHMHCLIHEVSELEPIRKCVLQRQWQWGHSAFKLAKPEAARYVCKYLVKSNVARVRASLHYGACGMIPAANDNALSIGTEIPYP